MIEENRNSYIYIYTNFFIQHFHEDKNVISQHWVEKTCLSRDGVSSNVSVHKLFLYSKFLRLTHIFGNNIFS